VAAGSGTCPRRWRWRRSSGSPTRAAPSSRPWRAAFGPTLGRAVLLGYLERRDGAAVDPQCLKEGRYEVAIGGELFGAAMTLRAPYDPERARVLA
jgi:hypothetical protein